MNHQLRQDFHTNSESAGVRISAMPAATLHAPTPMFLIDVGYNSAVYVGMMVFPALIVNFPKLAKKLLY